MIGGQKRGKNSKKEIKRGEEVPREARRRVPPDWETKEVAWFLSLSPRGLGKKGDI